MYFGDLSDDYDLTAPSNSFRVWKSMVICGDRVLLLVVACSVKCANNARGDSFEHK